MYWDINNLQHLAFRKPIIYRVSSPDSISCGNGGVVEWIPRAIYNLHIDFIHVCALFISCTSRWEASCFKRRSFPAEFCFFFVWFFESSSATSCDHAGTPTAPTTTSQLEIENLWYILDVENLSRRLDIELLQQFPWFRTQRVDIEL